MGSSKKSAIRRCSLTLAIVLIAGTPCFSQPTSQELAALSGLPINGYVVFTNGDPTSEMGRGKGVYRFTLKQTSISTINARGRWATIHPSGSIIAYAKPAAAIDAPNLQTEFYNIVLTDPNGTELCRLSHDSIPNVYCLAWTDDNRIIFGAGASPDQQNGYGTSVYMIDMNGRVVLVKSNVTENPRGLIIGVSELGVAGTHILFRRGLKVYLADFNPANPQNGWTNEIQETGDVRCGSALSYDGTQIVVNTLAHNSFDVHLTSAFPAVQKNVATRTESDDYHFVSNAGDKALYKQWLIFCTQVDMPRDIYVVNKDAGGATRVSWTGSAMAPTKPFLWLSECTDNTAPTQGPQNPVCTVISSSDARLSWGAATDPDCKGIVLYRISRHNESTPFQVIGISFTTAFEDLTPRTGQVTTYGIQAVNSSGLLSPMVAVTVNETATRDTTAPKLQEAYNTSANNVWAVFDEPIDSATAVTAAHYALDNGVQVLSASLSVNGRVAALVTTKLVNGQAYTVIVSNIKDRAAPANTLASASATFTALIQDSSGVSEDTVLTLLTPDRDTVYRLGDTLKVAWAAYDGPVIVELSLNNGRGYPILLSPDAVWGNLVSWVIPNDQQYLTDSARVRIMDYVVRTRIDISAARFRIRESGAHQRYDFGASRISGRSEIVLAIYGTSAQARVIAMGKGISLQWQVLVVGMDGRIHAALRPDRVDDLGMTAEFASVNPKAFGRGMCILIARDERGSEQGRGMLLWTSP
jgi:hypothetical protein